MVEMVMERVSAIACGFQEYDQDTPCIACCATGWSLAFGYPGGDAPDAALAMAGQNIQSARGQSVTGLAASYGLTRMRVADGYSTTR